MKEAPDMRKRMMIAIAVMVAVVAALGIVKFQQIRVAIAQSASFQPPPEAVTTVVTTREAWTATLGVIGTVSAVHGVVVSADLPGVVRAIEFESGRPAHAGQVLVRLDTSQEKAQLTAAEAQLNLARLSLERMGKLRDKQVVSQAEFDRATAEFAAAEGRVGEIRATIARKTIRAPFSGVLGIRSANLGEYLNPGAPIVPLQSLDPIYVDFAVPQQDATRFRSGAKVSVASEGGGEPIEGRVTAINSVVDQATRNVQIQATFANAKGRLRPGMFVELQASLGATDSVIALPASAISYAPYGNSVFVVAEVKGPKGQPYRGVQQRFVTTGAGRGDQIAVVTGLRPGEEVVTSGVFKLRNGAAVVVNNAIRPTNDPAPKPEDS